MKKIVLLMLMALLIIAALPGSTVMAEGANNALDFDDIDNDEYVTATGYDVDTGDFTLEAWIYPDDLEQQGIICQGGYGYNHGFLFDIHSTGRLRLETADQSNQPNGTVEALGVVVAGEWQHIAVSVTRGDSGGLTKLYLNGKEVATGDIPAGDLTNTNLYIGTISNSFTACFDGKIDEVRIWNDARTPEEIRNNMNKRLTGNEDNLVTWYRFDASSGTTLTDYSPSGFDGTISPNMGDEDWVTSTAPIADASHIGTGTGNLAENGAVPVDISWDADPGSDAVFAALQINERPDVTTGLPGNTPASFWEVWIGNDDGDFQADVTFHYDNISGIGNEATLSLYGRNERNNSWVIINDITRNYETLTDDGTGSITANDLTGFSQFIITSSDPVNPLPELPTILLLGSALGILGLFLLTRKFLKGRTGLAKPAR